MRIGKQCVLGLVGFAALASAGNVAVGDPPGGLPQRSKQINAQLSRSMVAVRSPEGNKLSVVNLLRGEKVQTYTAPPGTELRAHVANDLLGVSQQGPNVKEVVVYDAQRDEWSSQALPEPAKELVQPVFIQDSVIFPVGKCVYAYRSAERRWKTLTLPTDEPTVVMRNPHAYLVQQGNRLYVYSALNGLWTGGIEAEPPKEFEGPGFQSVSPKAP